MVRSTYDSKDLRCKTPYGAVQGGTPVQLTLRPLRAQGFSRGILTATLEARGGEQRTLPMPWMGHDLACDLFRATLDTEGYVGLIWYSFVLEGIDGRRKNLGPYQLTVYDPAHTTPTWFGEGLSYQIFPDRFARSEIPDPTGLVGARWVHQGWSEQPEHRPDHKGEIRNRDFFGGNLTGVLQKLDYLHGLGVETLYFTPVFEAAENHRYGTADYDCIDPMLGSNEVFTQLCDQAHRRGMRVMLDGVFNHTGFVSKYFNGDGFYPQPGASQSEQSPYRPWFNFTHWPDQYESWWGIYSLPAVDEHNPDYRSFIFGDENSVVRRWLRAGADGWRLDVADELPDDFVQGIHQAARAEKAHAVVIGEVWEDGSTKMAYGVRRKHLLGGHCDGLMNYPLRGAILSFFQGGTGEAFVQQMETLRENYPSFAFYSAMNSLGTHDTPRILTLLGSGGEHREQAKQWRADFRLSPEQRRKGRQLLMAAAALLFVFPGSPTVYYGDEAGMEGFEDPFNRQTYPWGSEDQELLAYFRALGQLRKTYPALRRGEIDYPVGAGAMLLLTRTLPNQQLLCAFHAGEGEGCVTLDKPWKLTPLLGQGTWQQQDEGIALYLPPRSGTIFLVESL